MTRRKHYSITLYLPERTNFSYDDLTRQIVGFDGIKNKAAFCHTSIVLLWRRFHPNEMPLTLGEMVKALMAEFNTSQSAVVHAAVLYHAGTHKGESDMTTQTCERNRADAKTEGDKMNIETTEMTIDDEIAIIDETWDGYSDEELLKALDTGLLPPVPEAL